MTRVPDSVIRHDDMEAMTAAVARTVRDDLEAALADRGQAVLAVSGGSTPAGLYRELSRADIGWAHVTVVLVDERWVEPAEPGSNEGFVRRTLLNGPAAQARFVGLKAPGETPFDAVGAVARRVADLGPIDVAVLGMGADGHTASWFPHARGLDAALARDGARVAAVEARPSKVTGDHVMRMTLTLGALAEAGRLVLMMRGGDKREALQRALAGQVVADMPVRALLKDASLPLEIHWTD